MRIAASKILLIACVAWAGCDSPSPPADNRDGPSRRNEDTREWTISLTYPDSDLSEVTGKRIEKLMIVGSRMNQFSLNTPSSPLPLLRLDLLRTCSDIEDLYMSSVRITTLEPLAELPRLKMLKLARCEVENWDDLKSLVHLTDFGVPGTPPPDLAVIAQLPKLTTLNIRHCGISDLSPLHGHRTLRKILLDRVSLTGQDIWLLKKSISGISVEDTYP